MNSRGRACRGHTVRRAAGVSSVIPHAQAQTVIAAAILRHLHAVITTGQAWDPAIATHGAQHTTQAVAA